MPDLVLILTAAAGVSCALVTAVMLWRSRRRAAALRTEVSEHAAVGEVLRGREVSYRALASEQGALRRVATAVAGQGGPGAALDLVAEEAARLLDADIGQVCRFAGTRAMVVGSWGQGALPKGGWYSMFGSSVLTAAQRGKAARVDDYGALTGHDPTGVEVVHPSQFGAVASPIWVDSRLWGVLLVVNKTSVWSVPRGAEGRLDRFAELVALAVSAADERERLRGLATTDPLTGLPNRRAFEQRLAAEIERSSRHGHPLSVVLLDIDHFKRVNDTWGHQVGDDVLMEFARRLASQARGSDLVARIGGEEFAWLLPDTPSEGARDAAERVRRVVTAEPFRAVGDVTSSLGVADIAAAGCDTTEIIRVADAALYMAKRAGRNRTVVATPGQSPARPVPVAATG